MLPARAPDTLRPWAPTTQSWLQRLGQFYRPLPAPALPIMHRLAILYLMLPVVLWLLSWFRWWVGWPLALLVSASLGPVLAGSWRGRPRLATWGLLAAVLVWVMLSPAGGVFNAANHKDWVMRHALLLDLGRYPWPLFLPDSLAAYVPGDSPPPPLPRYYLGWHLVPGLAARLGGAGALQWAVPLWTGAGTAFILCLFAQERRGWGVAASAALLIFFSGLDIARVFLEGWHWPFDSFERNRLRVGLVAPVHELAASPQHFLTTGLYALLLYRLRRQPRFLAVSGVLLAAAPFWSALGAIGLLPLAAALAWTNGLRPFLRWPNLIAAAPLGGVVLLYLTADTGALPRGWLWEWHGWPQLARWLPVIYLSEFLLLTCLLLRARPALRREPFFLASLATLLCLPLYAFGYLNNPHNLSPARMLLACFCADLALGPARAARWSRAVLVGVLALGALNPVRDWARALWDIQPFRYAGTPRTTLTAQAAAWYLRQYVAFTRPRLLNALLRAPPRIPPPAPDAPSVRGPVNVHGDERGLIYARANCRLTEPPLFLQVRPASFADFEAAWPRYRLLGLGAPGYGTHPAYEGYGLQVGAACAWRWTRPRDVSVQAAIRTGQVGRWEADLFFNALGGLEHAVYRDARALREAYDALATDPPDAVSVFDVRLAAESLTLTRDGCADADLAASFFLHVVPYETAVLPPARRGYGFIARNFPFPAVGSRVDDRCWTVLPLPAYGIRSLRVGQFAGARELWRVELPFAARVPATLDGLRAAYRATAAQTPAVRADFDVYLSAHDVTFVKNPCRPADVEAKFILHVVPAVRRHLPAARRRAGFANLDFPLDGHGAFFDGICFARQALPAYPVDRLRVGQFLSREQRVLWQAEIPSAGLAQPEKSS